MDLFDINILVNLCIVKVLEYALQSGHKSLPISCIEKYFQNTVIMKEVFLF